MSMKDTDFMSELEAATSLRPATPAIFMLFVIIGFILFVIVWAGVSEIEEMTRGRGKVVPSQEVQVVQSLEGGILAALLIKNGDKVKKGQILLQISDVQFSSDERSIEARFLSLSAKKARLKAEADGVDFVVPPEVLEKSVQVATNERELYISRQKELKNAYSILEERIAKARAQKAETSAQVNRLYGSRKLLNEELALTREMVKKRAVPKLEEIRLQREVSDIAGQINALAEKKKGLVAELNVAEKEKESQDNRFRSQALSELGDVESELSTLQESLKSIGDRVYRAELRSPVDGIVNNIALTTIGGVIEPAQRLIEIVPLDDELKIIAQISPAEIAFIHPGQPVKVKVTAYDAQKYGALDGTLVRIGATSVSDREGNTSFEVEVRTNKNYMGSAEHPLPITPGMVAEIEIITGKRTILDYLLKPILRARDRAFTER